jgi:hypothetical protein
LQIASRQDVTEESATENQKVVVYAKGFRGKKIPFDARKTDIAHCVVAAKSHGPQNLGEDFVLCKKK